MRRKLQKWLLILVSISVFCFGCINAGTVKSELPNTDQRHVLERLSFGINSEQLRQVQNQGIEAYIQSQLDPSLISESPYLEKYIAETIFVSNKPLQAHQEISANNKRLNNDQLSANQQVNIKTARRKKLASARQEAINTHIARSIYSNRQLQEVMVDFWFNHFNVFAGKGPVSLWTYNYENQIRANALGNFRDLLQVTASHPAMLIYLDNHQSKVSTNPKTKRIKEKINENYARELMELHTLGVDGGYTQKDIIALAKIFTGWSVDLEERKGSNNGFLFYPNHHDQSDKIFLGQPINAKNMAEGEAALDILAAHPATARHISYKLAQYFVADEPPASLVDKLAKKFEESEGNIKIVLDTLIHSDEFNNPQYYGQKFKNPYQYLISLIRMGEIEQADIKRMGGMLLNLSMPVYMCTTPDGYKNNQSSWLSSRGMLQRISFASAIARGVLNREDIIDPKQLENNLGNLSEQTNKVIAAERAPKLRNTLMLGSPEAMYR